MAKKDEEEKKAAKAAARERVSNRLAKGKNISVSDISEKTGVSEKRAQRIINRAEKPSLNSSLFEGTQDSATVGPKEEKGISAKKYFKKNEIDPGKRLVKSEAKAAMEAGVSAYNLDRFSDKLSGGASDRAQAFLDKKKGQVSTKMKDYDTSTAGGKRFTKADIKYLMSEEGGGHSLDKIQQKMDSYQNDTSVKVGLGAQDFLDKKVKQMKSSDDARLGANEGQEPPAAETPPASPSPQPEQTPAEENKFGGYYQMPEEFLPKPAPEPTPSPTPSPEPNPAPNPSKPVVNNNNFANSGTFIGNNNQGNDYSVNIAGEASSNLQGTAQYMAMNDNAFAKSQAQLSGLGRSSQQVEAANLQTNSAQDIANTDYLSRINPMYMGAKATQSQTQLYGDTFKFELPNFEMPVPGKKPKDETKENAEMYMN